MAITGSMTYKGLTISAAYLRVMDANTHTNDSTDDNGDAVKTLNSNIRVRVYVDAAAKAAAANVYIDEFYYTFTPTADADSKNILEQAYVHLKTLAAYNEMTDI
jgi:hypothetical protein